MIERARHVPQRSVPWDPCDIATAIEEIVVDTLGQFDSEMFWPAHPLDDSRKSGNSSVYLGASGVIWALDYLWRAWRNQVPSRLQPGPVPVAGAHQGRNAVLWGLREPRVTLVW